MIVLLTAVAAAVADVDVGAVGRIVRLKRALEMATTGLNNFTGKSLCEIDYEMY